MKILRIPMVVVLLVAAGRAFNAGAQSSTNLHSFLGSPDGANPYAAMPSLHAADAFIVGISMTFVCRRLWAKVLWLLWPPWVCFTVMATGNHFWLDCLAGVLVALVAAPVVDARFRFWRRNRSVQTEAVALRD